MNAARKTRKVMRQAFTRVINDLSSVMATSSSGELNLEELRIYLQILDDKSKDLEVSHSKLISCLLEADDVRENLIEQADVSNDEYKRKFLRTRNLALSHLNVFDS